jgi:hypothetical protein
VDGNIDPPSPNNKGVMAGWQEIDRSIAYLQAADMGLVGRTSSGRQRGRSMDGHGDGPMAGNGNFSMDGNSEDGLRIRAAPLSLFGADGSGGGGGANLGFA